jgi:hypothetical protein
MSTAKKVAKGKSKPKIKSKPKSAPAITAEPGYGGHTVGSRKGTIHELFDKEGEDVAWTRGLKIGLKQGTLRSWFAAWKRLQNNSKETAKTNSSTPSAIKSDSLVVSSETAHP